MRASAAFVVCLMAAPAFAQESALERASAHWQQRQSADLLPGEGAAGYVFRRTAATVAGAAVEPFVLAQRHQARGGPWAWEPDGYGVTIYRDGAAPQAFRNPHQAQTLIASLPDGAITRLVLYGHGAPGLQTIGEDFTVDAEGVAKLARGKVRRGGRVDLIGCNTSSIGRGGFRGPDLAGTAAYGLSAITRWSMYYVAARLSGVSEEYAAAAWNADLARDASRLMPGVEVGGLETYGIPLDRLVPTDRDAAPSDYILGRRVAYLDGREI